MLEKPNKSPEDKSNKIDFKLIFFLFLTLLVLLPSLSIYLDNRDREEKNDVQFSISVKSPEEIKDQLNESFKNNSIAIEVAFASKVPGSQFYALRTSSGMDFYSDSSAKNILLNISGSVTVFSVSDKGLTDLSEGLFASFNSKLMSDTEINSEGALHKAKEEKARIFVFVDPACGYCQKFNNNLNEYLDLGISVEYLPFPIFGPRSEDIMNRVWSLPVDQRADALNKAEKYLLQHPNSKNVDEIGLPAATKEGIALVEKYRAIAIMLGFSGTPGIYLQGGQVVKGYVPAKALSEKLKIN